MVGGPDLIDQWQSFCLSFNRIGKDHFQKRKVKKGQKETPKERTIRLIDNLIEYIVIHESGIETANNTTTD